MTHALVVPCNLNPCHHISKNSCDFMFRGSSQDVSLRDDLISNLRDQCLHSQEMEGVKTRDRREGVEKRKTDNTAKDCMKQ